MPTSKLTVLECLIMCMTKQNPDMMAADVEWANKLMTICDVRGSDILRAVDSLARRDMINKTEGLLK